MGKRAGQVEQSGNTGVYWTKEDMPMFVELLEGQREYVMNNGQVKSERGYPILIDIQRCLGNHVIRPGVNLHN